MKTLIHFPVGVIRHALQFFLLFVLYPSSNIFAQAPGGVSSNLRLWLKANVGTSTSTNNTAVSQWSDQSVNGRHATQSTSSQQAIYKDNSSDNMNFNSVVDFTASSAHNYNIPTSVLPTGTGAFSMYIVSRKRSTAGMTIIGLGINSNNQSINVGTNGDGLGRFHTYNNGWAPDVSTMVNDAVIQSSFNFESGMRCMSVNSVSYGSSAAAINLATGGSFLGANHNGPVASNFEGEIGEVIIYSSNSTSTEKAKIESYLSMKYGITKSGDYVNSNNNILWNASSNSTYHNNVTLIGRDDASRLIQKQSRSVNSGFQPVIGNEETIDTSNNTNNSIFSSDQSFLAWGSNTAGTSFTTPYMEGNRMARIWKVQETGTIGSVKVGVLTSDVPGVSYLNLLVSNDATIDNNDLRYQMSTETIGGLNYFTTVVDFSDGQYFNFMSSSSPLPVTLLDFTASCDNENGIDISWKTSGQEEEGYFILERSEDGTQWTEIQKHSLNQTGSYSVFDQKRIETALYYRLTLHDLNDTHTSFPVIMATCSNISLVPSINTYPNPGEGSFTLSYISPTTSEMAMVRMIDYLGNILHEQSFAVHKGENKFNIAPSNYIPGIYTIEFFDGHDIRMNQRHILR